MPPTYRSGEFLKFVIIPLCNLACIIKPFVNSVSVDWAKIFVAQKNRMESVYINFIIKNLKVQRKSIKKNKYICLKNYVF